MPIKLVTFVLALAVSGHSVPVLPFVDSSLPVTFREVIAENAPEVPSNLASFAFAVDLSAPVVLNDLKCLKQSGYSAAFVRVYNPAGQGSFDTNAVNTISSSYYAGLGNEIYMTPQPLSAKAGYQQLDEVYQGLQKGGINIRSIWIQVTSPTNWLKNPTSNVNFINSIISRARQYGMGVGIYTSSYDWSQITNGWNSLSNDILLWYWNVYGPGVNGETPANFQDFRAFGSFTAPSIKQYAQVERVCQINVNRDVYAVSGPSKMRIEELKKDVQIHVGGFIGGN